MRAIVPVVALLLSVSFLLIGHGLTTTLLPLRALIEHYSSFQIGVLGAAYFFGFGAGSLLGPYVIRRVGHIRAFAASIAVVCIALLFQAIFSEPILWWVMRGVTGLCLCILYIIIESWLNEKSTRENRGFLFSIYMIINLGAVAAGQLTTTLANPTEFTLFAVGVMLFSAATFPVSMTNAAVPAPIKNARIRLRQIVSLSPVATLGAFAVGLANGAFWSLGPVFAQQNSSDTSFVAVFMSVTVLAGAIGQFPLGYLSDRIDRRIVIILTAFGASVAAIGHLLAEHYWRIGILPCAAFFGLFAFPLYSLCAAHLNDFVESDGYVEAASGLLLIYASGAVTGPLIAAALMDQYANEMLFVFTACVHGLLAIFTFVRKCCRTPPSRDQKLEFSESIIATGTVANIDLRAEH